MPEKNWKFEAIGTHWQIDIFNFSENKSTDKILHSVKSRIEKFEQTYSRFRSDSLVAKMSKNSGLYHLENDAKPMFDVYEKLYKITNGAFTPLIGQTLVDAGYDPSYSLNPKELQKPPDWESTIKYHFPFIEIKKPVLLDFGAAGKGYLIDIIANFLESEGLHDFCIDAGGDIVHRTTENKYLKIGLENPANFEEVIGIVEIKNKSICGSSGSRRKWKNFHHTINPHTLTSPANIIAIWVVAESGLIADALTTSLYFTEPKKLEEEFSFEYIMLMSDFSCKISNNFPGEIFTTKI